MTTTPTPRSQPAADVERARAAAQLVEHVDGDGNVIEIVTRADMRARSLRHRSVYITVQDTDERLLVHKRADWKDVFPGAWDLAFGGICDPGETWHRAASRELLEEAGVTASLTDLGPVSFEADDVALVGRWFTCVHDGPFTFNDGEVVDSRWIPLAELDAFLLTQVVPDDTRSIITRAQLQHGGGRPADSQ